MRSPLIFIGNANRPLGEEIARHLGVAVGRALVSTFKDGETRVDVGDSVREGDVFIIQPTCPPVNDNLMELLLMLDAMRRASAHRITAVVPYYGYSRQEKRSTGREPISAKLVANLMVTAGADHLLTIDLTAPAIEGFFDIPVDNLGAGRILADYCLGKFSLRDAVVVSPDVGGVDRANKFRQMIGTQADLAVVFKEHPEAETTEMLGMVGEVGDKTAIIVDDIISTGTTLIKAAELLIERGASEVYACATHPVFAKGAIERINDSAIEKVIVTDSIPIPQDQCGDKIEVASVASLLAEAITCIQEGRTISTLYKKLAAAIPVLAFGLIFAGTSPILGAGETRWERTPPLLFSSQEVFPMAANKSLSADSLFALVRAGFGRVPDQRAENAKISLPDALMSGFAMFSLKDPSLLAYDERRRTDSNLKSIYGIQKAPCDTQMRTILDDVEPVDIRPVFKDVFRQLQRKKKLDKFIFLGGSYLVSLDGTGYFSSKKVHCQACLQKVNQKTGEVTYYHQLLGGVVIHPDRREVIPLMPEPIMKQDGETKNDCERNAAKRFLAQLKQDHPHLSFTITEDALSPNAPHIRELEKHGFHYILGVKEGDHEYLFEQVALARQEGRTTEFEQRNGEVLHRFSFINQMPLNKSNPDVLVNFVEYWEIRKDKTRHFSWVTDFTISKLNVFSIMRGGRARWKVENETFNTLKNQGYHFEHNFGHGKKNLSVVFAVLMMLAFLVDQVQQLACALFQAVLDKKGSRKRLWEHMRALFRTLEFKSMEHLFKAILYGYKAKVVILAPP